ncbi:MAG: hypothetical protein NZ561_00580, partial [Phycisphaerae bacterium]|nr:hypothetical protein [Phycisphaerae bacterium]MDW8262879.1 hypothetical protein [Phycisphaerales bacterium]
IDRIDAVVSADPYLLVLRAGVAQAEGKSDAARMLCDQALVREPTLLPAADALLTDALQRKDFKTAKALMLKMERTMSFTFGPLDQSPAFTEFLQSPQYLEFEKERPRR